ncbi:HAD family hydrolase [Homoserinibacter sp. YIM 151385]|uniref:HAD family hydrolase n=1 Tax=Homoserinibacter sp. YIM 151385 TaxID=2985506 RepID=UPI0022F141B9|nr:beta-phosphoglucomutase family hydrolase [Homoserinibacter sp. YIM 151385]WBU37069.1 beta-phosphoglucomutase family hydrolase [Homoserinibacter sp. YIM 151385]
MRTPLPLDAARAILYDLDGVLTPTAEVHMRAWARLFTEYLAARGDARPYTDADYFSYIDGRPRYDGVRAMLASRDITLPEGEPTDSAEAETVCGLGNRKNAAFTSELEEHGVAPYPGSVAFLDAGLAAGIRAAVVSSSANAVPVLRAAGLLDRVELVVDAQVARAERLPGKPAPDTYLHAASALGIAPEHCVVVEDAHSGVEAGARGGFGLVLGVNRGVGADTLTASGADLVVDDLAELTHVLVGASRRDGED